MKKETAELVEKIKAQPKSFFVDLKNWAALFRQFLSRNLKVYAYANNHYAGHGPGTVKLFWDMWEKK